MLIKICNWKHCSARIKNFLDNRILITDRSTKGNLCRYFSNNKENEKEKHDEEHGTQYIKQISVMLNKYIKIK